jgi:hypothetical protein
MGKPKAHSSKGFEVQKKPIPKWNGLFWLSALCSMLSVVRRDFLQKPQVPPPDFPHFP